MAAIAAAVTESLLNTIHTAAGVAERSATRTCKQSENAMAVVKRKEVKWPRTDGANRIAHVQQGEPYPACKQNETQRAARMSAPDLSIFFEIF